MNTNIKILQMDMADTAKNYRVLKSNISGLQKQEEEEKRKSDEA